MRGIQLPLSKTQKVRLQKTLEQLESLSSKVNSDASVIIADSIPVNHEDGVLKGHGTADLNGEVVATVCGVVERVNKLVYVRALRSRYKPEVGDIVIGRVVEVAQKRWRLDINFNQDAVLMLSSMNMPDGVQRRRTALDELNMRCIFEENDVVCAEVRGFQHDGLHLQARSRKYGKIRKYTANLLPCPDNFFLIEIRGRHFELRLNRGQLLSVPPYLVKRQKQHFHHLEEFGIDLIIGCNGFIWVGEHIEAKDDMVEDQVSQSDPQVLLHNSVSLEEQERSYTILETRKYICRAANAVRVLSILGFNMTLEIIKGIIDLSLSMNLDIHEMLGSEFCVLVAEKEAERRSSNKKKR